MRFTMIVSSRSLNQPFLPLNQLAVAQGPAGMSPNEKMPTIRVRSPFGIMLEYQVSIFVAV